MRKKHVVIEPEFYSVSEAEILSSLSRWTWRRWAYDGKIASVKVGPRLLIPKTEIHRIMGAGLRPARIGVDLAEMAR